ncbi:TonB family protein [Fulvivirga sp. M361]|uniref:M56 family metallopeptidase n=1 Tax=Fulvivirga sp. M361 TaxID=2594266 RepID=UPI00117A6A72|nr:M56 family metallopeptidase [Fulvivirga sp. M361]TRX52450.1 TonB family protein [Fulvivirga sp. M361]
MIDFINFYLEANMCLLALGGIYYLFLARERQFQLQRFYILLILVISLIVPVLSWDIGGASTASDIWVMMLPELVIGDITPTLTPAKIHFGSFITSSLVILYFIGVLVLITLLLSRLFQILKFYSLRKPKQEFIEGQLVLPTNGQFPTFSFFHLLFFDNTLPVSLEERMKILQHEKVHIMQYHSVDIIFIELAKSFFWINPMIWALQYSTQNIHEYLADEYITKDHNPDEYSSLLAKMALNQMALPLGNHFNKSLVLKRIKMMKTPKSKLSFWKWGSAMTVTSLVAILLSCNDDVINDVNEVMSTAKQVEIPVHLQDKVAVLKEKYPNAEFVYLETDISSADEVDKLQEIDQKTIAYMEKREDSEMIGLLINKNGPLEQLEEFNETNEIFSIVEEPAMPIGGYDAFYAFISDNLKYPVDARKNGVEGRVYVQFIVDEEGNVSDVIPVKGIGGGCDEAAASVVATSGKWSPPMQNGQKVKQRIILPISFKLPEPPPTTEG